MKNIGIVTGNLKKNTTGMGTYTFQVIEKLKNHYNIEIIKHPTGDTVEGCQNYNYTLFPGPYWYFSWSRSLALAKKTSKKYDLFHNIVQYPISPVISRHYAITIYDLIPILYPSYVTPFYSWQSRIFLPGILKKASIILSISQYTKNDIITRYQIDPEKIFVTPLGVSDHFHPIKEDEIQSFRLKYNLNNPFLLFVGAIEPKKNIPTIIRAFYTARKKKPELELVIAGKKAWKYQEVFNLIDSLKLNDAVHFLNFIPYEELPILYSAASVFVFPSNYEGFGLPPLEAMKCGTPVIVSNRSSLPEIVGPHGLMIEPDNYIDLAKHIEKILDNDSFREEQVKLNLDRAKEFTWDRCANLTKKAYEKILDK